MEMRVPIMPSCADVETIVFVSKMSGMLGGKRERMNMGRRRRESPRTFSARHTPFKSVKSGKIGQSAQNPVVVVVLPKHVP